MILLSEFALVLFGMIPRPWNAVAMFLNGMPLGMIFGLILGQLEGRRMTEALQLACARALFWPMDSPKQLVAGSWSST